MFRYLCSCLSHNGTQKLILCTCISRDVRRKQVLLIDVCMHTEKKLNKNFLIYKKIHKGGVAKSYMTNASSYMVKYLRIASYIPLIWLCNRSHLNFLLYDDNFNFFLSVLYKYILAIPKYRNGGHNNSLSSWKAAIYRHRATTYEIWISVRYRYYE